MICDQDLTEKMEISVKPLLLFSITFNMMKFHDKTFHNQIICSNFETIIRTEITWLAL